MDRAKLSHEEHLKGCSSTFRSFKQFMESINKYVKRAVIDIQYYLNSSILDGISDGIGEKSLMNSSKIGKNEQLANTDIKGNDGGNNASL